MDQPLEFGQEVDEKDHEGEAVNQDCGQDASNATDPLNTIGNLEVSSIVQWYLARRK